MRWSVVTLVLAVAWLGLVAGARARRVHRDRRSARNPVPGANIQGKRGLAEMVAALLPNTFYSRPKFRYPYYHKDGKGELLYGYGGRKLYQYSIFKPLEGYF